MKRGSRILLAVVLVVGLLLVLVSSAVLYVGLTESGTGWVLERVKTSVNSAPGSMVQWRSAEGTLLSGLEVRDLRYTTTTEAGPLEVAIARLAFGWQPFGLFKYALVVDPLQIEGLSYAADGVAQEQDKPPLTADELSELIFGLPISIELQNVALRDFSWRNNDSNFALSALSGFAALNDERLQLTQLQVQQDAMAVNIELALDSELAAEGALKWQTRIADQDYSGELTVTGNLQQLQLTHVLAQPFQVTSDGVVVPGFLAGPQLSLDLRHTFDVLDLAAFGQPEIILQQGDIATTGSPAALEVTGMLQGQVRDLDPLTLNVALAYQPELLTINSIRLGSNQIDLSAKGVLQLAPRSLQLDWTLANLNPGPALPQVRLAGVAGEGSVAMNSTVEGERINLALTRIEGSLNELPLAITGMFDVINAQLTAANLQVNSGANVFTMNGTAAETLALDWQLQAPQLQQLWQGLDGAITGQGSISGTPAAPQINGRLDGNQISLQSENNAMVLQSFQLQAEASTALNDIELNLGPLSMQSAATQTMQPILEQGSVALKGNLAEHTLGAELALAGTDVMFELQGTAEAGAWRGMLQSSRVNGSYGNWQQDAPVALAYGNGALNVNESCWSHGLIDLCLQADQDSGAGLNANLDLRNVPLAWLDAAPVETEFTLTPKPQALQEFQDAGGFSLPPGLQAEGTLGVQVELVDFADGSWDNLDVVVVPENIVLQVDFSEGLASEDGEAVVERFGFAANAIHVSSSAGTWSGEFDLNVVKQTASGDQPQGNVTAQLAMTANEDLDGELAFGFDDLGWIETVVSGLREPYGSFNGRIGVSGTRSAPLLNGQLQLVDAGFALPDYGVVIADIELVLRSLSNDAFVLEGSANSGDGALALTTTLDNLSSADRRVTAEITGTDFSVINTAYARANVSPQLQILFENGELTIAGGIILPLLDLDIETMFATVGTGGVDVSRDVIVINAAEQDAVTSGGQKTAVPLHADISLLLGENVRLRGYGLNTRLDGELSLEQAPSRPVLVYGEVGIPEGSFEIYNQMLNAKDGRLMFFGNPANPVVDIRAYRETNDAEVGMQLSGDIKNMQGTLYSSPALPEDEILALLITGKSFNNVSDQDSNALLGAIANFGLGRSEGLTNKVSSKLGFDSLTVEGGETLEDSALGLGKYITPDLLLRYKVGLFDRQSVLGIDYNLTDHIKLEVETGISQSVDISYTIETD